jgi:hypothetical protein
LLLVRGGLLLAAVGLADSPAVVARGADVAPAGTASVANDVALEAVAAPLGVVPSASIPLPAAQSLELPHEQHPWMRHTPGSWREFRLIAETLDPNGRQLGQDRITQREVLTAVDATSYVIELSATVETAGRVMQGQWQPRVLQSLVVGQANLLSQAKLPEVVQLSIDGRTIECEVWEIRYHCDARQLVDRLYYNANFRPYILQRETTELSDEPGQAPRSTEQMQVTASTLPYLWHDEQITCSATRTVRQSGKGRRVEVALTSLQVPGGEVAVWSTEWDAQGNQIGAQTVELVAHGCDPQPNWGRTPWLPGRRARQQRRQDRAAREAARQQAAGEEVRNEPNSAPGGDGG